MSTGRLHEVVNWSHYWTAEHSLDQNYDDLTNFSLFLLRNFSLSDLMFDPKLTVLPRQRIWPYFFWITFLVGLAGNWLVIYVICRKEQMRTVTNMYLLNLAIGDVIYLMAAIPNKSFWTNYWPLGEFMCKFISYFINVTMTVGVLTLTAVGLDRHYALLYPISSRHQRTLPRTVLVVVIIWIFSMAVCLPSYFIARKIILFGNDVCLYHWPEPWSHKTYAVTMFVFLYVVPQAILLVCYSRIGYKHWFSVLVEQQSEASLRKLRTGRRIVKMIVIVTVAFAICWLPVHVMELYMAFGSNFSETFYDFKLLAPLIPHFFITANPFIYNFMSKTFHTHFKAACICFIRKSRTSPINDQEGNAYETFKLKRQKNVEECSLEDDAIQLESISNHEKSVSNITNDESSLP